MPWRKVRFVLGSVLLGAALCGSLGSSCYVTNASIIAALQASGNAAIKDYIDSRFVGEPNEVQQVIAQPLTGFLQSTWGAYLNTNIAQDLPNNTIALR